MGKMILIVDDSPVMRSFIRRSLQIAGYQVSAWREAANGREGLERLSEGPVDLILTDINMPVMDGEGFVRAVKADEKWREIPVVVISTDATHKRVTGLLDLGAAGYLRKPFEPERLEEVLGGLLDREDGGEAAF
jgi:two-component system chemotaxis response regulator CheY